MLIYFSTFFIALAVTVFFTPAIRNFALKTGAIDTPNERKIHHSLLPRLGGLSIYIGFISSMLVAFLIAKFFGHSLEWKHMLGLFLGSTLILLVGVIDDYKGIRPLYKFLWQILAAIIIISFGVSINFFSNPFNGIMAIGFLGIPLTMFWIVGVTNAINLIDGLDGLAAGVTAISAGALFIVALRTHQMSAALIMLALCGSTLGFLRYNFFPAKIFLGDSGSYFLGFILSSASIIGVFKTTLVVALIIPVLILGVPIFDTIFAIGRRLKDGKSPFAADKLHIHHMLLRAGFTQREAVLSIYVACFLLSIGALLMALQK